jgi:putative inorganic carbon (hco3(-)) transporter
MIADSNKNELGALFDRSAQSVLLAPNQAEEKVKPAALFGPRFKRAALAPSQADEKKDAEIGSHSLAFAGLFVFTLLLYVRPGELFPDAIGDFPLMKIVAILTLIVYIGGKLGRGERLSIWPLEMSMLSVIILLGIILIPIAAAPKASIDLLTDTFFKVVVIFVLMINLVDTRKRLRMMMKLVVISGAGISAGSIAKFVEGKFTASIQGVGVRIEGLVGGIFGNPNDLAMALDMLLPLAIVLALTSKPAGRLFYSACAFVLAMGVVVTFSRGGFLGLAAAGGILLWKLGRDNKLTMAMAALAACLVLGMSMPAGYTDRLFTIIHSEQDTTNSAQERTGEMKQALEIAAHHLVFGIGMGNYPFYSNHAIRAHNAYVEIAGELGVSGLIAYLILIFAPLRSLKRIERETSGSREPRIRELHYLSAGVHAAIISYVVCAIFSSAQYQWYLFYVVGYALSLRRLHAMKQADEPEAHTTKAAPAVEQGMLWKGEAVRG